jgi:hypothetical protein
MLAELSGFWVAVTACGGLVAGMRVRARWSSRSSRCREALCATISWMSATLSMAIANPAYKMMTLDTMSPLGNHSFGEPQQPTGNYGESATPDFVQEDHIISRRSPEFVRGHVRRVQAG